MGKITNADIVERYRALSTEELIDLYKRQDLTEQAKPLLVAELSRRDAPLPSDEELREYQSARQDDANESQSSEHEDVVLRYLRKIVGVVTVSWFISIEYQVVWIPALCSVCWLGFGYRREKAAIRQHLAEREIIEHTEQTFQRAQAGDPNAQYEYGMMVLLGKGITADRAVAMDWIRRAAENNNRDALFKLGRACLSGAHGLPVDEKLGLEYFRKAHELGHDRAGSYFPAPQRRHIEPDEPEWSEFKTFLRRCDSEPEALLLKALIRAANLRPSDEKLTGTVQVMPQAQILSYRVDFLVNEWLVVEVDGKLFHDNPRSFDRDRRRDQNLVLHGYRPIRFPASQVYRDATDVANIIIRAAGTLKRTSH